MTLAEIGLSNGQRVTLRLEQAEDEPLLFQLYASTREDELALTGWDAATRAQFLQGQFQAQRAGYRSQFPNGEFNIVLLDAAAIGRLVLNQTADELRLVDIVLAPAARNRGLGTALVQAVLAEAARQNKAFRLHVIRHSPAVRLYERLGFRKLGEHGFHDEMKWRPAPQKP